MNDHEKVSRKDVGEDRIAICPKFGCDSIKRVKPLKFGFFGFGKYPKCKQHHIPLVYVDDQIEEFVDGALACLFDKAGLPPSDLLEKIIINHPDELKSFVYGWVYCITTGRGAPIVSRYLDSISKAYIKKLKKKQVKTLKNDKNKKSANKNQAIKNGMKEITLQYTRLLKHLRVHSEVLVDHKTLTPLTQSLRNDLNGWQKGIMSNYMVIEPPEKASSMTLTEIKYYYDQILNVGTCRCLIGMELEHKKLKITAFDRFSTYLELYKEGLTSKFTKSDINNQVTECLANFERKQPKNLLNEKRNSNSYDEIISKNSEETSTSIRNWGIKRVFNLNPQGLVYYNENDKGDLNFLDVRDNQFLQKKKLFTYSSSYSDGDVEFWISSYKLELYGGSWKNVIDFINRCNKILNIKIKVTPFPNGMVPIVKTYYKYNNKDYNSFLRKYGAHKTKESTLDEDIRKWILVYQDPNMGGSIAAIKETIDRTHRNSLGETTIRRHIKNFFLLGKYKEFFGEDITYNEWLDIYKRNYYRKNIPVDPKIQSHESLLLYYPKYNKYKRVFFKDLWRLNEKGKANDLQIFCISRGMQPIKTHFVKIEKVSSQQSIEIECSHGSVIITPNQSVFTIDDDCNIREVEGRNLIKGLPILMPRFLKAEPNGELIDFKKCGRVFQSNDKELIEMHSMRAHRYVAKTKNLGSVLGQYIAEGTYPSKYQPGTIISVSVDKHFIHNLQKIIKKEFGLDFQIVHKRVKKCKTCGTETIKHGDYNICPNCENSLYHKYYALRVKSKLAKLIFTEGFELTHAYSYNKELPPFLYNAPKECEIGFLRSYFRGDGCERDYREKGGSYDLNFETTSRRLVFGLNFLFKKYGVIPSVVQHDPPLTRPNSKKNYSIVVRGSSNFEALSTIFDNLPDPNYTTSDVKTAVNTQVYIKKLRDELESYKNVSFRELVKKDVIPRNVLHVANQIERKTNLSETLLLKMLDGLKMNDLMTPIAQRMENIFRNNTFTKIKRIITSKNSFDSYNITVEHLGYCCGTAFIYVKSDGPLEIENCRSILKKAMNK